MDQPDCLQSQKRIFKISMSHFLLSNILRSAFRKACAQQEVPKGQINDMHESRRKFLKDTAIAGAGVIILPSLFDANVFDLDKKIVIVGAGMAGLNAAYQLQKMGLSATVYEAANRTGGRMYTMRNIFGENISTDIGGEFVDATHLDIIALAKEFNLDMYQLSEDKLTNKTFYFQNTFYSEQALGEALQPFVQQILADIISLPQIKDHTTAAAIEKFDNQSITVYIKNLGIDGWLYNFLCTVFTSEFGIEVAEQSALNFLIMFVAPLEAENKYELFGQDHEVMKIKGGSQQLSDAIANTLKNKILLQHELKAIHQKNNQTKLTFLNEGREVSVKADYVIMTLAFTKLKSVVMDLPMAAQKRKCIDELGYGNSSKFIMGFNGKPWRNMGRQGYTFTDENFGTGWDSSQLQSDTSASFTVFGGGNYSVAISNRKEQELSRDYVTALNKIYKGASSAYTGKNIKFCWQNSPVAKAGYSCYKVGQYSTIGGWESTPVGNVFFAGEHTSRDFQGYMNGAAESGRKVAEQIAAKILIKKY